MVIDAKGKDKRGNGTAGAHVTATMTEQGTSTHVEVLTDLNITGKPAQFGRGVMEDVSNKLLGQFTACLEQKVGDSSETTDAAAAAEEPTPAPEAESRGRCGRPPDEQHACHAARAGHADGDGERGRPRPGRHGAAGPGQGLLEAGSGRTARAVGVAVAARPATLGELAAVPIPQTAQLETDRTP